MTFATILFATFLLMEVVAYVAHRTLFHGVLWFLHRSHHEPRKPGFEWNDVFGPFFAVIAIVLIGGYAAPSALEWTRPVGAGMTLYGAVYFFVHDMYTHRRFWRFDLPFKWFEEMRRAHRHHHSSIQKEGQEPFGFIYFQTYEPRSVRVPAKESKA
jgi:beta-carotene 3-hydroxylase